MSTYAVPIRLCKGCEALEKICEGVARSQPAKGEKAARRRGTCSCGMNPYVSAAYLPIMAAMYPIKGIGDTQVKRSCICWVRRLWFHLPITRDEKARWGNKVISCGGLTAKIGQHMLISVDIGTNVVIQGIVGSQRVNFGRGDGPAITCNNRVLCLITLHASVTYNLVATCCRVVLSTTGLKVHTG